MSLPNLNLEYKFENQTPSLGIMLSLWALTILD